MSEYVSYCLGLCLCLDLEGFCGICGRVGEVCSNLRIVWLRLCIFDIGVVEELEHS